MLDNLGKARPCPDWWPHHLQDPCLDTLYVGDMARPPLALVATHFGSEIFYEGDLVGRDQHIRFVTTQVIPPAPGVKKQFTFMYKIIPGVAPKSHGFETADRMGMPKSVTRIAELKYSEIESGLPMYSPKFEFRYRRFHALLKLCIDIATYSMPMASIVRRVELILGIYGPEKYKNIKELGLFAWEKARLAKKEAALRQKLGFAARGEGGDDDLFQAAKSIANSVKERNEQLYVDAHKLISEGGCSNPNVLRNAFHIGAVELDNDERVHDFDLLRANDKFIMNARGEKVRVFRPGVDSAEDKEVARVYLDPEFAPTMTKRSATPTPIRSSTPGIATDAKSSGEGKSREERRHALSKMRFLHREDDIVVKPIIRKVKRQKGVPLIERKREANEVTKNVRAEELLLKNVIAPTVQENILTPKCKKILPKSSFFHKISSKFKFHFFLDYRNNFQK